MTLVTPPDFTAGEFPTAAKLDALSDMGKQLQGGTPSAGALDFFTAVQATAQTGLTTSTFVSITFATTSEIIDSAGGHSTTVNPSRYVPQAPGYCELSGLVAIAGDAGGARRLAQFAFNGTAIDGSQGVVFHGGSANGLTVATPVVYQYFNGTTDYLELQGWADYASWATLVTGGAKSRLNVRWVHS